ncbi:UNKNOWN [Stylonychia lemnae]|uniref:Uncharacterized protein n=1 Tax=Stylonychia lemnae TaxID=5949 RepID=A0A078B1Y2_STYLE|nr:UNKNOWN [Stylonychia lemnae]|eukprot:CDW88509.1 UNKNOWN [Stylonychia lemnae]
MIINPLEATYQSKQGLSSPLNPSHHFMASTQNFGSINQASQKIVLVEKTSQQQSSMVFQEPFKPQLKVLDQFHRSMERKRRFHYNHLKQKSTFGGLANGLMFGEHLVKEQSLQPALKTNIIDAKPSYYQTYSQLNNQGIKKTVTTKFKKSNQQHQQYLQQMQQPIEQSKIDIPSIGTLHQNHRLIRENVYEEK